MKTLAFQSFLAKHMHHFINLKRLSGIDYRDQAKLLWYFDQFLVNENIQEPVVTREITDRYQQSLGNLAPRYQYNRFCVVKLLCEHIAQSYPLCYVPDHLRIVEACDVHCPYIFTEADIRALLSAASALQPQKSLLPQTYQMLFGILYTTGIRIGEALALNLKDFHIEQKMLCVVAGKFRKDRWIPLHPSTSQALER